jgi:hypothetical protein
MTDFKEQAENLIAEFSLNILAEMGHKLPMNEVTGIAKRLAIAAVDKIINQVTNWCPAHILSHWMNVKKELDGKDQ